MAAVVEGKKNDECEDEFVDAFEDDRSRVILVTDGLAAFGLDDDLGGRGSSGRGRWVVA